MRKYQESDMQGICAEIEMQEPRIRYLANRHFLGN